MTSRKKAESVLLAMTVIWGSTFVVMKLGLEYASACLFVALRFTVALTCFSVLFRRSIRTMTARAFRRGLFLGLLLGIGLIVQNVALKDTTASKSAFVTGTMVIFTPMVQLIVERRLPKIGNVLGVVIVTLGLFFLTSPTGAGITTGDLITLVAALLFGIYIVYIDVYTKEDDFVQLGFMQLLVTAVIAWTLVPFEESKFIASWSLLWQILYMALFATVLTTYANTKYQKYSTPTRAAILYTFEPVVSAILAYIILGEMLGVIGAIGAALIIFGILVSELSDSMLDKIRWKTRWQEED
ncbi:MAG: DMT family transporter [Ignavibacteriales bacterium]|nr:DMT family transporter [Ignavibacteriales bacterium]